MIYLAWTEKKTTPTQCGVLNARQQGGSMTEHEIEQYLVDEMDAYGGWCLKYTSSVERGLPDRLCMFPSGKSVWIELKRPGKKPSPLQCLQISRLKRYGQTALVIDSKRKVDTVIAFAKKEGWFNDE